MRKLKMRWNIQQINIFVTALLMTFIGFSSLASASVPSTILYNAEITSADGTPVNGTVDLQFHLFDNETDGSVVWSEDFPAHNVTDGRVMIELGATSPLDDVFDGDEYWLQVTVESDRLSPRMGMHTVPHAFRAADAARIAGQSLEDLDERFEAGNLQADDLSYDGLVDDTDNVQSALDELQRQIDDLTGQLAEQDQTDAVAELQGQIEALPEPVDLDGYVTTQALDEELGNYALQTTVDGIDDTLSDLQSQVANLPSDVNLEGYVTTVALDEELGGYVTNDTLSSYVTNDALTTTLGNYALQTEVENLPTHEDLNDFVTTQELEGYVTSGELAEALLAYALQTTVDDIGGALSTLEGEVVNLPTHEDLNDFVTTQALGEALEDYVTQVDLTEELGNYALQSTVEDIDIAVSGLTTDVSELEQKTTPISYVEADDSLIFSGVNVFVQDGSGDTVVDGGQSEVGLGNLIIGYNEEPSDSSFNRNGNHNLVIGPGHSYEGAGGLVAGLNNSLLADHVSVTGGENNRARAHASSISGGETNVTWGDYSSILGGYLNTAGVENDSADSSHSSVSGGMQNTASGQNASVSGGWDNTASGQNASVSGGSSNEASGTRSSVSGGSDNKAQSFDSSVSGGLDNLATGPTSSVSGGRYNEASQRYSSVSGGRSNIASGDASSVIGGNGHEVTGNDGIGPDPTVW